MYEFAFIICLGFVPVLSITFWNNRRCQGADIMRLMVVSMGKTILLTLFLQAWRFNIANDFIILQRVIIISKVVWIDFALTFQVIHSLSFFRCTVLKRKGICKEKYFSLSLQRKQSSVFLYRENNSLFHYRGMRVLLFFTGKRLLCFLCP